MHHANDDACMTLSQDDLEMGRCPRGAMCDCYWCPLCAEPHAGVIECIPSPDDRFNVRCQSCGHVGDRVFVPARDGGLRDVLGGETGVRPEGTVCSCGSLSLELVPVEAIACTAKDAE